MDIWLFTNDCIVFCIAFVRHTRLDLSVMSLTNEILIIRPAANTINNEKSAQRDANTARALAVLRFRHRLPVANTQTHRQS